MSHHIHHTEGFILGSTAVGEANRYITIFTRELGVIGAVAQGVRKESSKLRYALQDYSHARVDVIHGKHSWRIISASPIADFDQLRADPSKFTLSAKILMLIRRLCSGEDPNEELFVLLRDAFRFLNDNEFTRDELGGFELVFLVRMLRNLGYMDAAAGASAFFGDALDMAIFEKASLARPILIKEINAALQESQL